MNVGHSMRVIPPGLRGGCGGFRRENRRDEFLRNSCFSGRFFSVANGSATELDGGLVLRQVGATVLTEAQMLLEADASLLRQLVPQVFANEFGCFSAGHTGTSRTGSGSTRFELALAGLDAGYSPVVSRMGPNYEIS